MSTQPTRFGQQEAYSQWVARNYTSDGDNGLKAAIGGQFSAFGIIELEMLKFFGLREDSSLVDVGCGSGRLAAPMSKFLRGNYLGTDVVKELVLHAKQSAARNDWRFAVVDGPVIPLGDQCADMVCFFSVLTHLLHEQSYIYLGEAKRVLKPGGRIVFSFLEFAMDFHWSVFKETVDNELNQGGHPLNMFIERSAIMRWAEKLELEVQEIRDGSEPFVPLQSPVILDDGRVVEGHGNLGQSVCVLVKR